MRRPNSDCSLKSVPHAPHELLPPGGNKPGAYCAGLGEDDDEGEDEPDGAPCCPDPDCNGNPCTFPGYADNH